MNRVAVNPSSMEQNAPAPRLLSKKAALPRESDSQPNQDKSQQSQRWGWWSVGLLAAGVLGTPATIYPLGKSEGYVIMLFASEDIYIRLGAIIFAMLVLGPLLAYCCQRAWWPRVYPGMVLAFFFLSAGILAERGQYGDYDVPAYRFQARVFSMGQLSVPALDPIPCFQTWMVNDCEQRNFGKYPYFTSLALSLGTPWGLEYWIPPLFATFCLLLFWRLGTWLMDERGGRWLLVLAAACPLFWSKALTPMSQVFSLFWILVAVTALVGQIRQRGIWGAVVAGLALGMAFNCRPLSALLHGTVLGGVLLYQLWRYSLPPRVMLLFIAAGLTTSSTYFFYNSIQTGNPRLPPYVQYCPADQWGLGTGRTMDSDVYPEVDHTLAVACWSVMINFLSMGLWIFGNPVMIVLLLAAMVSTWQQRLVPVSAWVITGAMVVVHALGYAGHWWAGTNSEGPAYYYELIWPVMLVTGWLSWRGLRDQIHAAWLPYAMAMVLVGTVAFGYPFAMAAEHRRAQARAVRDALDEAVPAHALVLLPLRSDGLADKLGCPVQELLNAADHPARGQLDPAAFRDEKLYARWIPQELATLRAVYPDRPVYRVRSYSPLVIEHYSRWQAENQSDRSVPR